MAKLVVNSVFVFVIDNPEGEGIPAMTVGQMVMPLVGADMARVDSLRPYAQELADTSGRSIKILEFSVRRLVDQIEPTPRIITGRSH